MVSYCICQTSAPLLTMHVLSQFFLHAVIRQECVVCGDCSLAFLKGLETTRDAGQATLHPILQVFIYHLEWSECRGRHYGRALKKREGGKKPKDKSGDGTLQITETSLKTKGLCRQKWQQGAHVWENFVTEPLVATKCHTLCATTKNKNRRGRRREAQSSYLQRELLQ